MKLTFVARGSISEDGAAAHERYARSAGVPFAEPMDHPHPLAVVGGGPSINDRIDELRNWPGEIWAVNGTYRWCVDNGIDAVFFSVDPNPSLAEKSRGAKRALLGTYCAPAVFDSLAGREVRIFDVKSPIPKGPTSATCAPALGVYLGHKGVSFFGCEGSWEYLTHGYAQEEDRHLVENKLLVECGGREFLTCAEYLLQTEYLAAFIRSAPEAFRDRSGGLLAQMIETPEYDVRKVARELMRRLESENQ